jgi:hypothetical protein
LVGVAGIVTPLRAHWEGSGAFHRGSSGTSDQAEEQSTDTPEQPLSARNNVGFTDPADDMTYWVGAMTDYNDLPSSSDQISASTSPI